MRMRATDSGHIELPILPADLCQGDQLVGQLRTVSAMPRYAPGLDVYFVKVSGQDDEIPIGARASVLVPGSRLDQF